MWATEVYNPENPNPESYWFHYQWWNNYWFQSCWTNGCNDFPNWEFSAVQVSFDSSFAPSKYASNTFIWLNSTKDYNRLSNCSRNNGCLNIRWWGWDSSTENWSDTEPEWRRWPCPQWYHIPSEYERGQIITWWSYNTNNIDWTKFASDLLLPPAGNRRDDWEIERQGKYWHYRSSSPSITTALYATYIWTNFESGISIGGQWYLDNANSVRCIKDTPNNSITINTNDIPSKAIVIIDWKEITTLYTRSLQEWKKFWWWYSDSSYTDEIEKWEPILTNEIYAKWDDGDEPQEWWEEEQNIDYWEGSNEANIEIYGLSGDYTVYDLDTLKGINDQISPFGFYHNTDDHVVKIQEFTQKWDDLDIYFLWSDWEITKHTMMDRNMWATEVYNQNLKTRNINTWSFWFHYQWWNKYWFKPCYSINSTCNTFPWWEKLAEWGLYNVIRTNLPWTFANNIWNRWYGIEDPNENRKLCILWWYSHEPYSLDVRRQMEQNLWWWYWDTKTSNGNGSFEWQDCVGKTIQWHADRQWPCPDHYHIPSVSERNDITTTWIDTMGYSPSTDGNPITYWPEFSSDLLLPPAGIREGDGAIKNQWIEGAYQSSSPKWTLEDYGGTERYLTVEKSHIWLYEGGRYSAPSYGLSLRCIKDKNQDSSNLSAYTITIEANWWTNAVIALDWDKITALSSPTKAWADFLWWYSDPDFYDRTEINKWDTIAGDTTIYARRSLDWDWWGGLGNLPTRTGDCVWLPDNAYWVNSGFKQTWRWYRTPIPENVRPTYTWKVSVECSFLCKTNYTRNEDEEKCKENWWWAWGGWGWWETPQTSTGNCTWLPNNAHWINSGFKQTWDWNSRTPLTNDSPTHTWNASVECSFQCNTNYTRDWEKCNKNWWWDSGWGWGGWDEEPAPQTQKAKCTWLPSNAYWNNREFTQTKNWNSRVPLTHEITNSSDYNVECSFLCMPHYTRNGTKCAADSNQISCTWLPSNAHWITHTFTQTWNGSNRIPTSVNPTHSSSSSIECSFECDTNYSRSNWECKKTTLSEDVSSNLSLSVSNKYPDTDEWVKLTIDVNSKYTWKINFNKIQYYNTSTDKRSNISISSSYISDYSDELYRWYVNFSSSDYWRITISRFIKFSKSGKYKIFAEDNKWNSEYVQINVEDDESTTTSSSTTSSSSKKESNISISLDNSNPKTHQPIDATIKTDNYVGTIRLYAKYKDSSNSWIKINNADSTYFSDYSNIWEMWFYKLTSSDKWKKTLSDLIEFKKAWDYRIYAEDEDWYFNYNQVSVYSSSNDTKTTAELTPETTTSTTTSTTTTTTTTHNSAAEVYKSRSCKEYEIKYNEDLWAFTSPNLIKTEYFVSKDYLKRYIDSKNPRKDWCPTNEWRISIQYSDTSSNDKKYIAPNGKIYYLSSKNNSYYSDNLSTQKNFSSINEMRFYIRDRNPIIKM